MAESLKHRIGPVSLSVGQPLRVAIYSSIAGAIRSGAFGLGSLLPNEAELGAALGVSRTVVREALMLLEEDGLVRTRRGIGRFVADALPRIGLEQLRPIEAVFADAARDIRLQRINREVQPASDFLARGLGIDDDANAWVWESVLYRDDEAIALSLESIPAGRYLQDASPALADRILGVGETDASLFATISELLGTSLGPGECHITVGLAGAERGGNLGLAPDEPVLLLTQTASHEGRPLYLAKHVVSAAAGNLSVIQSVPTA